MPYRFMPIHEVLSARFEDVVRRWEAELRAGSAPEAMPIVELVNHMPSFIDQIIAALRDASDPRATARIDERASTATAHGEQRLRLGFSLDAVVREYGTLSNTILGVVREAGEQITFGELHVLSGCIINGIAYAVSEYTHQRDAELQRHINEHFAFIAHELRNPLWSATLAFGLLRDRAKLPPDDHAVAAIERGLHRATELVDQTLQMARVASGIELRRQPTRLLALFDDATIGARPEAEAKGIEIRSLVANDARIDVDLRLVRSALDNLVRNAVKYTAPGSMVELRGRVANERLVIEVEDRCGGLPPGKVEEAFAPFVRLERQGSGFGLGLAIAKQAVDAHGGTIRVQNLPGKGCIFVLELPMEQSSAAEPP